MKTKLLISMMAVAMIAGVGIIAENKIGIVDHISSPTDETLMVEFGSIFESAAIQQFAEAPRELLDILATSAVPLVNKARQRLSESSVDANDVPRTIAFMLMGIAGRPESGKDVFILNTVAMPILAGANYGKFVALRDGTVESEDVNKTVTAYAATALDGLSRFLSDLPQPEKKSEKSDKESNEERNEESSTKQQTDNARQQLDKWSDQLPPV